MPRACVRKQSAGCEARPAPRQAPFAWHDASALRELFEPHGFTVSVADAALPFVASSPAAFAASELRDHPAWVDAAGVLDTATFEALHAEVVRVFADANEDRGRLPRDE